MVKDLPLGRSDLHVTSDCRGTMPSCLRLATNHEPCATAHGHTAC